MLSVAYNLVKYCVFWMKYFLERYFIEELEQKLK